MISMNFISTQDNINEAMRWLANKGEFMTPAPTPVRLTGLKVGTTSGKPSVSIRVDIGQDVSVITEMTLALFEMARIALGEALGKTFALPVGESLPKLQVDLNEAGEGDGVWSDLVGRVVIHAKVYPVCFFSLENKNTTGNPSVAIAIQTLENATVVVEFGAATFLYAADSLISGLRK